MDIPLHILRDLLLLRGYAVKGIVDSLEIQGLYTEVWDWLDAQPPGDELESFKKDLVRIIYFGASDEADYSALYIKVSINWDYGPHTWWDQVHKPEVSMAAPRSIWVLLTPQDGEDESVFVMVDRVEADRIQKWCEQFEGWVGQESWHREPQTCLLFEEATQPQSP